MATYKEEAVSAAVEAADELVRQSGGTADDTEMATVQIEAAEPFIAKHYEEKARKEVEDRLNSVPRWTASHIISYERDGQYVDVKDLRAALASQEVER